MNCWTLNAVKFQVLNHFYIFAHGQNNAIIVIISFPPLLAGVLSVEFEWQQVSCPRTLWSNIVDLNTAVVCVVFILLISNSFSVFFPMFLETVPSIPSTIGITFMFHTIFQLYDIYLFFFSLSFIFTLCSVNNDKIHSIVSSFFLVNLYSFWSSGWD